MMFALALSGGGHRAAAFHLGVLKYLARRNMLERIDVISSTSGGSILAAQLFHHLGQYNNTAAETLDSAPLAWPSSQVFLDSALAQAEALIINQSLEQHFIRRMFHPKNWFKVGHRANLMADVIAQYWAVDAVMHDLPAKPDWVINGTTNVTGSRWFVQHSNTECTMGSDDIGTADAANYPISDAVALSAAYPGVIGPYRLNSQEYSWRSDVDSDKNQRLMRSEKGLYLSDGGLYDNLGLEPLFNLEQGCLAYPNADFLIVSDAGSHIKRQRLAPVWRPILRTLRLINVIGQQIRDLRLRSLLAFLNKQPEKGVYIPIGLSFAQFQAQRIKQNLPVCKTLLEYPFLSEADVLMAKNTATSLASLSSEQCQLLIRHGFESAMIQCSMAEL